MNKLKLNSNLLKDDQYLKNDLLYKSCWNAKGLYNSVQFVLRLRPDIHALLDKEQKGIRVSTDCDFETAQAFSTYLHETIHWWQHIGSISGFILSLSYPSQLHINKTLFADYIRLTGLIKPIVQYNELNATEFSPSDEEFQTINQIINNYHDIEFFRILLTSPKNSSSIVNHKLFESLGHSFHIAYSSFVGLISTSFDRELQFLPNIKAWEKKFKKQTESKVEGFYHGSDVYLSPIGIKDLFEGQARFIQIQYLYFGSGKNLTWDDFESLGMLSGIYYSAFEVFLTITGTTKPTKIDNPLIALFLLILDISINPSEGFPFEIEDYDSFLELVDPGKRFFLLCEVVKNKHPELKSYIKKYSSSEYFVASSKLCKSIGCKSPIDIANLITSWANNKESLLELMVEEKTFNFKEENQPVRVLFSRFIRFQEDKLKTPEYFCWTGFYTAGNGIANSNINLFSEHQSLFVDKADGDIYPRTFNGKDNKLVKKTFDIFYTWLSTYDLSKQWITDEGEFEYDFLWLSSKHSMEDMEVWARHNFKLLHGVDPVDFEIVKKA